MHSFFRLLLLIGALASPLAAIPTPGDPNPSPHNPNGPCDDGGPCGKDGLCPLGVPCRATYLNVCPLPIHPQTTKLTPPPHLYNKTPNSTDHSSDMANSAPSAHPTKPAASSNSAPCACTKASPSPPSSIRATRIIAVICAAVSGRGVRSIWCPVGIRRVRGRVVW